MKKNVMSLLVVITLAITGLASAGTVTYLELGTALGVNADYSSGVLELSAGSSGWLGLDDGVNTLNFSDVDITATFSNPVGTPLGSAIAFQSGTFEIIFNGYVVPEGQIIVSGNLALDENFAEAVWSSGGSETGLIGMGVVDVTAVFEISETPQTDPEDSIEWLSGSSIFTTQTLLDTLFSDYGSQTYGTDNTIVQLWAEGSTWVPEPATMSLLGLGSLMTLYRRKRK